jgi:NADH-quinone oxidoreductase F subunit
MIGELTQELRAELDRIVSRYEQRRAAILPVLRLYQERYGFISEEIECEAADYLGIPRIDVREVVSFYTLLHRKPVGKTCLNVCRTLACRLKGSEEITRHLESRLKIKAGETTPDGNFTLEEVECLGACEMAPMMQVNDLYAGPLTPESVDSILAGQTPAAVASPEPSRRDQVRLLSKFFERGGTYFIDDYLKQGGYEAARQAFEKSTPEALVEEVKKSNLRGLGGAGFPAGIKWSFVPKNTGKPVYLVVNADEGEPGTFKDRYILVNAPHLLLEGIVIASYANQVHKAFIYLRGEYQEAYGILLKAIREAEAKQLLGKHIFGKNYDLEVVVHRGAGAYIAGEETGLLESLEGKKAFPRLKPPFPAVVGLFGCPTVINNVETLAYLPYVVKLGGEAFAKLGSSKNGGLRLFSVSGHVARPGVYERPCGYSLRQLIEEAGGVRDDRKLKAVVPGGLSAAVLRADEIEVGLDFDQLKAVGTMAGSAGVMVMDETTCMVEALLVTMRFFAHESCGQCSPCREGTGWVLKVLQRIWEGGGRTSDIDQLLDICSYMGGTTICALADGAAMPLGSYLRKFRGEFEFHIREKRCDVK